MATRPLLIFPTYEIAERSKLGSPQDHTHYPGSGRQGERIGPRLLELERMFEAARGAVQPAVGGAEPERVLVLETVGTVTDFQNAVRRIAGMEWMAEFDAEDILPDADFFDRENPQEPLGGRLFLVASNQDALRELLRLWNVYQTAPAEKFAHGYGKWKELFRHLHNIRVWGVGDRLRDTGVLRAWEEELSDGAREQVSFEAELWFRRDAARQQQAEAEFRRAVEASGGMVVNSAVLPQIAYHGVIGQLPSAAARRIIQGEQVQLLQCEDVMFVRASGQAVAHRPPDEPAADQPGDGGVPLAVPRAAPRVALLDGLPIENHVVLRDRLRSEEHTSELQSLAYL